MGGQNPYIPNPGVNLPTRTYRVTFMPMHVTVKVDPSELGDCHDGLPGSILDIAARNGVVIDHACGGVCACSTCHVVVKEGFKALSAATEAEEDMLENAPGLKSTSRLACQAVPDGSCDLVVEIPGWNRNLAKEPPH